MNQGIKDTVDIVSKLAAAAGIVLAALNYRNQTKTKRAEWLRSLFEKFYEANNLKEARKWIESGEIEKRIDVKNTISADEEKLADYLNFFEFIATLESDKQLKYKDVLNLFDYYLTNLRRSVVCMKWVNEDSYGFEKLRSLFIKMDEIGK